MSKQNWPAKSKKTRFTFHEHKLTETEKMCKVYNNYIRVCKRNNEPVKFSKTDFINGYADTLASSNLSKLERTLIAVNRNTELQRAISIGLDEEIKYLESQLNFNWIKPTKYLDKHGTLKTV